MHQDTMLKKKLLPTRNCKLYRRYFGENQSWGCSVEKYQ